MRRATSHDNALSAAVGLLSLLLYVPLVPAGVLQGDPGEFQFALHVGGIVHPTGYPLYCLLGWGWSHLLPIGSAAYRINLLSAVPAAIAVGLVCRVVLTLCHSSPWWQAWLAAASAALAFATSPTFWSQSVIAEVYSLHASLLAALILAALSWGSRPSRWWAIGLLAGLNLAHHRTSILFLPACVAAVWMSHRRPVRWAQVMAAVALIAPLSLYLYIPVRAPHTPYLHQDLGSAGELALYDNTLPSFIGFILGQPFSSSLTLKGLGERASDLLARAPLELSPLIWLLALAGLVSLWQDRRSAAVLFLGSALPLLGFNLIYAIGDIHVLYIPLYMLAAILAGIALARSSKWFNQPYISGALALVLAVSVSAKIPAARSAVLNTISALNPKTPWGRLLSDAPSRAILISNDRDEIMPMWYHQYVEHQRPDLTGLFPLIVGDPSFANVGRVIDVALRSNRPVLLTKDMPGIEVAFQLQREPPPIRVVRRWRATPQVSRQDSLGDSIRLLGYDLAPSRAQPGGEVVVTLYWQPVTSLAAPYSSYVHVVTQDGSVPWPGSDHRPGGDYYPATLWQVGEVIRDEHVIALPEEADAGHYRLIAGMYMFPSLEPLGQAIELGPLLVGR